ncbi:MAG: extracellular solute-binding protein [Clostridium sp.]|nr:extracellular solute-binding protein [Clostridium sp.]
MKSWKKFLSILMILAMTVSLFTGCGNSPSAGDNAAGSGTDKENVQQSTEAKDSEKSDGGQSMADSTAMGRYVETPIDISEYYTSARGITALNDGRIVIADIYNQIIVSNDSGATWSAEDTEWQAKLRENARYVMDIAYGADGTAGAIYTVNEDKSSEADTTEADDEEDGKDEAESSIDDYTLHTECLVIKPDGTQIQVQINYEEESEYARNIWITKTGRIFISVLGDNIYEVKENSIAEKYLALENRPEQIRFVGDYMVIDGGSFDGLILYDMEKEEYITDEVLYDFIKENYEKRGYSTADTFDICFFEGEDGALYIAGDKGLHRHVIGGSAIEQVIDGSLSSFSNPANLIVGVTALPNKEFIALFIGGKVVRYAYNPDIPTVPNERLKVYSLKENNTMRQAVSIYQTANPEVYVEYEVGIETDSSVTRDDALKKLNTQIMAGEGPDVLVLDDMPIDSYIEKNLLLDLSDCINKQELFENIVEAFRKEGKIYMIPCEIQIPLVQGREKDVTAMKDLKGIADTIEALRKEKPGKPLLKIYSERGIMRMFSMVCAPSWTTAQGELDKEAIGEFLTQCKRIYEAELEGIPEEYIVNYNDTHRGFSSFYGGTRENSDYFRMADCISYLMEDTAVNIGTVYYPHGTCEEFSVNKVEGHENDVVTPMEGMSQNVFMPKTLIGINAASGNVDRAKEMIKTLLGSENQKDLYYGLSIHREALAKSFEVDEKYISEEGVFSYIGLSTGDGRYYDFEVYVMEPEQLETVQKWIEDARTPYIEDTVIEDAVYTEGTSYIRGNKSLEETVNAIEQSIAIYMSE